MTRAEQETVVRWAANEDVVYASTARPSVRRKFERAGYLPYEISRQGGREVV